MPRDFCRTEPVRGTLVFSLQSVASQLIGLLFYMFLARLLPLTEIGVLSLMIFMLTLFSIPQLALPIAATRFIASSIGRGDYDWAHEIASTVLLTVTCLTSFFALASYLIMPHLSLPFPASMLMLVLVAGVLSNISAVLCSSLLGFERFFAVAAISLVSFALSRLAGIVLVFFGLGLAGVVYGWILGSSVAIVVAIQRLHLKSTLGSGLAIHRLRVLLNYSLPLWVFTALGMLINYLDRVLFYMQTGNLYQLGLYDLSLRASISLSIIYGSLSSVALPFFSRSLADNEKGLERSVSICLRFLSFLLIPAAFGLAATSPTVFRIFYGASTPLGVQLLLILAFTSAIQGFSMFFQSILQAQARTLLFLQIGTISLLVEVFLVYILTPQIGVFGVALARAGMFLSLGFLAYRASSMSMNIRFPSKMTFLKILLTSAVVCLVTVFTESFLVMASLTKFITQVILGSISFIVSIFLLGVLNHQDFEVLERILPERAKPLLMKIRSACTFEDSCDPTL